MAINPLAPAKAPHIGVSSKNQPSNTAKGALGYRKVIDTKNVPTWAQPSSEKPFWLVNNPAYNSQLPRQPLTKDKRAQKESLSTSQGIQDPKHSAGKRLGPESKQSFPTSADRNEKRPAPAQKPPALMTSGVSGKDQPSNTAKVALGDREPKAITNPPKWAQPQSKGPFWLVNNPAYYSQLRRQPLTEDKQVQKESLSTSQGIQDPEHSAGKRLGPESKQSFPTSADRHEKRPVPAQKPPALMTSGVSGKDQPSNTAKVALGDREPKAITNPPKWAQPQSKGPFWLVNNPAYYSQLRRQPLTEDKQVQNKSLSSSTSPERVKFGQVELVSTEQAKPSLQRIQDPEHFAEKPLGPESKQSFPTSADRHEKRPVPPPKPPVPKTSSPEEGSRILHEEVGKSPAQRLNGAESMAPPARQPLTEGKQAQKESLSSSTSPERVKLRKVELVSTEQAKPSLQRIQDPEHSAGKPLGPESKQSFSTSTRRDDTRPVLPPKPLVPKTSSPEKGSRILHEEVGKSPAQRLNGAESMAPPARQRLTEDKQVQKESLSSSTSPERVKLRKVELVSTEQAKPSLQRIQDPEHSAGKPLGPESKQSFPTSTRRDDTRPVLPPKPLVPKTSSPEEGSRILHDESGNSPAPRLGAKSVPTNTHTRATDARAAVPRQNPSEQRSAKDRMLPSNHRSQAQAFAGRAPDVPGELTRSSGPNEGPRHHSKVEVPPEIREGIDRKLVSTLGGRNVPNQNDITSASPATGSQDPTNRSIARVADGTGQRPEMDYYPIQGDGACQFRGIMTLFTGNMRWIQASLTPKQEVLEAIEQAGYKPNIINAINKATARLRVVEVEQSERILQFFEDPDAAERLYAETIGNAEFTLYSPFWIAQVIVGTAELSSEEATAMGIFADLIGYFINEELDVPTAEDDVGTSYIVPRGNHYDLFVHPNFFD